MTVGEDSEGKEAAVDKFPAGMRVLAVDDDPVCLKLLESLLRHCKYHVTTAAHAETALKMLREGKDQFDLVISDVHMPDMDGFMLLEIIGLEMDLPVIMLSANGETKTVMKGITHGACDYLVKPVRVKELKNIWQHVVRRKPDLRNRSGGGNDDDDHKVQSGNAEGEQGGGKRTRKYSGKKRNDVDDSDENKENTDLSTEKKPRVTWTSQLHRKFVEVVNQIGIEKAVPKKILDMMNVDYITRENVASHLQKYRLYLKRVSKYTSRDSNLLVDPSERWNSVYNNKNEPDSFKHYHEHGARLPSPDVASSNSSNLFARMNSPSALGPHGLLTTQSIQLSNAQSNLGMGTVGHGGSLLKDAVPESLQNSLNGGPSNARNCFSSVNSFANSLKDGPLDARKCFPSGPSGNSFANISNGTMLDASECFPSYHSGNSYASILRGKLLEASKGIPSCHSGNSFADISNGGILAPANQFPVQSPELGNQASVQMKSSSTGLFGTLVGDASQLPDPGNCSNSRQTVVQSKFPDLSLKDGTSLGSSQANIPKINQLASFTDSSGQIPMFGNEVQNQMAAIMSSTESMAGLSEQMAPFNIGSNTSSKEMLNDNFALGSASSISSALRNAQMDSFVMPAQMLNGGGAGGILPVQDGTADQQAVDDQLNYSNDFLIRTNGPNGGGELEDIVAGLLNQNFIENDDAFMDGDWELVP